MLACKDVNFFFSFHNPQFVGAKVANGEVSEAEQIALEPTTELLALPDMTTLIEKHLTAIRAKYPQVEHVKHQGKSIPGELLVGGLDDKDK